MLCFSIKVSAQNFTLKISSKNSTENSFLNKINYKKKHQTIKSIKKEIDVISEKLKSSGYFYCSLESLSKKNINYEGIFILGEKIKKVIIKIDPSDIELINLKNQKKLIEIPIEGLSNFLKSISLKLEKKGNSFSKVQIDNLNIKENILFADLKIHRSIKRKINRVIIKGYDDFPESYIYHFLKIKKTSVFNQQKLKEISESTKSLPFITDIKKPEILFSKDSTILYMYLKKRNANSFDGLISFNSKEDGGGLVFNGHLDLKLNNILNTGEQFKILWKANGEERQQFKISTDIPYIFNSGLSTNVAFSIYKQDSTFLSTKFNSTATYNINTRNSISLGYISESSENTLSNSDTPYILDLNNNFIKIAYNYYQPSNLNLFIDRINFKISTAIGRRNSKNKSSNQFKSELDFNYLWKIKRRNFVFIRNHSAFILSNGYFQNELFRIGGFNSLRGYNEQSIFATSFSYVNLDYRYQTSKNSYLYSITDVGITKDINKSTNQLLNLGLGYLFYLKNSQINIYYTLNKSKNQLTLNSSRLGIAIKSYF